MRDKTRANMIRNNTRIRCEWFACVYNHNGECVNNSISLVNDYDRDTDNVLICKSFKWEDEE